MRIFTRLTFLIQSLLMATIAIGQDASQGEDEPTHFVCGKNHATEQLYQNVPGAEAAAEAANAELEEFTRNFVMDESRGDEPIIIPVVFHVVHFGGDENISDAQIESQIDVLNEDFGASNPNLGNVEPAFVNIIGNVGFQFRLAQKDPDGNCTSGIVRVLSNETFNADEGVKSVVPGWPRNKYLNIWVVRTIGSIGSGTTLGYTFTPGAVASPEAAAADGILIRSDRTGRIGTAANNDPTTLSHEVGHWANLEHPWGPSNNPGVASNCNSDDGVADTPNTIGYPSICPGDPQSCGTLDNIENIMDYSGCQSMFTVGQAQRMNAAMNSFIAQRNSLWTTANLEATGVLDAPVICQADFEAPDAALVCAGNAIEFTDLSYNGVQTRSWTFEGGSPSSSTESNPVVTYSTPGTYTVSLTVSNPNGSMMVEKTDYVTVVETGQNALQYTESFESFGSLEPNDEFWSVVNPDGSSVKWELENSVGYFSNQCVKVRGRSNSNTVSKEYLYSPTFDLSALSENAVLNFKYAHARRSSASDDALRIWISKDCGETWSLRRTVSINNLPTVSGNKTAPWTPASNDEWGEVEIDNIVTTFLTDEFRVRFEFESNRGNNLYLDYINLFDGLTSSLGEIDVMDNLNIYPNPTEGDLTLTYSLDRLTDLTIDVLDLSGRIVQEIESGSKAPGEHVGRIDLRDYPQGMYVIRLRGQNQVVTKRVVVM